MGDVKPTEQMKKVSLPNQKKRQDQHSISSVWKAFIARDNCGRRSRFLPKTRGGCVGWRLPAQTLGEELRQGRGSGPGSRRRGSACACGMVGAALADWGAHAQLHQQAKELSQSPTQPRGSWKNMKRLVGDNKLMGNLKKNVLIEIISPESSGLICLMRVAIAGVSLDLALGSVAVGSSVSMGAKVSPSRPMPSNSPPAEESTATASDSPRLKVEEIKAVGGCSWDMMGFQ